MADLVGRLRDDRADPASRPWSDRDGAVGGGELDRDQARFFILDPGDVDLVEGVVGRFAEEFGDGDGVAA